MTATYSVEFKSVSKFFGDVKAVDDVDLQVHKGEFFALLGPSGCGKTTSLRMIGGLEHPDKGDVFINGVRVNHVPPYERDASIVFQNLALFPHMTVAQNIAFGLKLKKLPRDQINAKVSDMLNLVQLSGMEKRRPDQLSGGQQQRVAVARSLILQPEVLLLDEPLAALDRKLRKEMQIELRRIQRDVGITFIYVTHDQKEALSMSDRIAVMKDGKIVQLGSPEDIYEQPRTRFVADFMGASNVFDAKINQQNDEQFTMRTTNGLDVLSRIGKTLESDPIGFSVRPEAVQMMAGNEKPSLENAYQGKVTSLVYLGDVVEVEVELESGDQLVAFVNTTAQSTKVQEGQTVWVAWSAQDSNLLLS